MRCSAGHDAVRVAVSIVRTVGRDRRARAPWRGRRNRSARRPRAQATPARRDTRTSSRPRCAEAALDAALLRGRASSPTAATRSAARHSCRSSRASSARGRRSSASSWAHRRSPACSSSSRPGRCPICSDAAGCCSQERWSSRRCRSPTSVVSTVAALIVLRVLHGSATAIFGPVASASVSDLAPPDRRGAWLSAYSTAQGTGQAMGPVLAGYLIAAGRFDLGVHRLRADWRSAYRSIVARWPVAGAAALNAAVVA